MLFSIFKYPFSKYYPSAVYNFVCLAHSVAQFFKKKFLIPEESNWRMWEGTEKCLDWFFQIKNSRIDSIMLIRATEWHDQMEKIIQRCHAGWSQVILMSHVDHVTLSYRKFMIIHSGVRVASTIWIVIWLRFRNGAAQDAHLLSRRVYHLCKWENNLTL